MNPDLLKYFSFKFAHMLRIGITYYWWYKHQSAYVLNFLGISLYNSSNL